MLSLPRAALARSPLVSALVLLVVGGCRMPGPKPALRPSGNGWACTRDRLLASWSTCERLPVDCDATAAAVRADAMNEGSPADIPPCHPQVHAACYTFHATKAGNDNFMCYETMKDCEAGQQRRLAEPGEYAEVSRCDEWD
jgi:hypothetical protein